MKFKLLVTLILGSIFFIGCGEDELSFDEKLNRDLAIIDTYLSDNNITTLTHESGIRYTVDEEGTGESPLVTNSVIVKYVGTFLNGQVFDSNSIGINFPLEGLIEAWQLMVPEMKEGGKITIYVPSVLGFDDNNILVFEIELVSIVKPESEQLEIDIALIDEYLAENNITAEVHSSGIRYQLIEEGTGLNPTLTDFITVTYQGYFLDGEVFDDQEDIEFELDGLIDAWKTMLPTIKEGGSIIIYAPSLYCFGNTGTRDIAPNSNLIFEIELISIRQ